ncbi:MAG: alpha/beta fold hydrolase [Acidobacteriota bacterium]
MRGERRPPRQLEASLSDPANDLETPRLEPPSDVTESWLPGPLGSVRILERFPDGATPVLFVHGLAGRAEHWAPQLAAVGPGVRAVAIDLPGHGHSDAADEIDATIPTMAATIAAVADNLGLRRFVLVGHSLGAAAALHYAGQQPGRVAGLMLVDPNGDQRQIPQRQRDSLLEQLKRDPREEVRWQFRQLLVGARPEVADRVLGELDTIEPEMLVSAFESALQFDPCAALDRYPGSVHSVISDFNTLPTSLHRLRPELAVSHIGGSGHWLMMDRPEELWTVLVDFLDGLMSRGDLSQRAAPSPYS